MNCTHQVCAPPTHRTRTEGLIQEPRTKGLLVVEDDPAVCQMLSHLLIPDGFSVSCRPEGAQVVENDLPAPFHLVLLDLNAPTAAELTTQCNPACGPRRGSPDFRTVPIDSTGS